jgi:hypothetical protein
MDILNIIIAACITVFSLGLLIVSLLSYTRTKNIKLIFVSIVFLLFFIRGILLSAGVFNEELESLITMPYVGMLDLIMLILLFIATLKR